MWLILALALIHGGVSCSFKVTTVGDDYASEVFWKLYDSSGNLFADDSGSGSSTVTLLDEEMYTFKVIDSFGDGICCDYGNGSITVDLDDVNIANITEFEFNLESQVSCATNTSLVLEESAECVVKATYTRGGADALDTRLAIFDGDADLWFYIYDREESPFDYDVENKQYVFDFALQPNVDYSFNVRSLFDTVDDGIGGGSQGTVKFYVGDPLFKIIDTDVTRGVSVQGEFSCDTVGLVTLESVGDDANDNFGGGSGSGASVVSPVSSFFALAALMLAFMS